MPQLRIKTYYGEVLIDFTDAKDLQARLDRIDFRELENLISSRIPQTSKNTAILDEFKDLCAMDATGKIILKKIPKQKTDAIKLTIFLANRALNTLEIKIATGIKFPKSYMNVKKDFIPDGDRFSLQLGARHEVSNRIIPQLRKTG